MRVCRSFVLLGATSLLVFSLCVSGRSQQISVAQDTYVSTDTYKASVNFGTSPIVLVDGDDSGLFHFDLSQLSSGTTSNQIKSATITFYVHQLNASGPITLQKLLQPFSEDSPAGFSASTGQGTVTSFTPSSTNSFVTVDVTSLVQDWISNPSGNYGVALSTSSASVAFDSKENTSTSHQAVLNITYVTSADTSALIVANSTTDNFVAGAGNGVPTSGTGSGGQPVGDTNTIAGTGNMPNPGKVRETTIFGSRDLVAYTGYCGTDATAQTETGLNVAIGDLDGTSLPANTSYDCSQPSSNTDVVMVGQKVLTAATTATRSTAIGNHLMDSTSLGSNNCFIGGSFTFEGHSAQCAFSEVLAHGGLANNSLSVQGSVIAGNGVASNVGSIVSSTLLGLGVASNSSGSIAQSSGIGAYALQNAASVTNSDALGFGAAQGATNVANSLVLGTAAGSAYSNIQNSVVEGFGSGGVGSLSYSVLIGMRAGNTPAGSSTSGLAVATAVGYAALNSYYQTTPDTGCSMEAFGTFAGADITSTSTTTPCQDVFLGYRSGSGLVAGSNNLFAGANSGLAGVGTGAESNDTVLGGLALINAGVHDAAQIGQGTNAKSNSLQFAAWNFLDSAGNGSFRRLHETLFTPAGSSDTCIAGDFADDTNYHYVCVAANTWKRVALSSF